MEMPWGQLINGAWRKGRSADLITVLDLAAAEAPFGGIKASGTGREGGSEGLHDYMNVKLAQMTL